MEIDKKISSYVVSNHGTSFKQLYQAFKPWFESFERGEPKHIPHLIKKE